MYVGCIMSRVLKAFRCVQGWAASEIFRGERKWKLPNLFYEVDLACVESGEDLGSRRVYEVCRRKDLKVIKIRM